MQSSSYLAEQLRRRGHRLVLSVCTVLTFGFCAQRRREYMERDSIRSDSKLFIGLFVAFVAPAVGILAWAYFSGYLDQLAQGYKRF